MTRFNVTNPDFNPSTLPGIDAIKTGFVKMQKIIEDNAPECARRTIALRKMEEACMYAVRAAVEGDE